jgi:hypothetical protein
VTEVPFVGGNLSNATRAGDTVRRMTGPWTPSVHALLRHLEARGFEGAPRVLGIDERGREILTYIEGDAPTGWPDPYPAWVWAHETLESAARLLRRYHDAVADFVRPDGAAFRQPAGPAPHEIVCHNDVGPFNTVFRGERAVAMLDWDQLAPGSRAWDLAIAVWRWVPVTHSPSGEVPGTQGERIRRFCAAYGFADVAQVVDLLPARMRHGYAYVRERAEAGEPGFVKIWSFTDGLAHVLRDAEHAERDRDALLGTRPAR